MKLLTYTIKNENVNYKISDEYEKRKRYFELMKSLNIVGNMVIDNDIYGIFKK